MHASLLEILDICENSFPNQFVFDLRYTEVTDDCELRVYNKNTHMYSLLTVSLELTLGPIENLLTLVFDVVRELEDLETDDDQQCVLEGLED